jgi:peptidoglycan/LPS O-acetylase OafA/YrhL
VGVVVAFLVRNDFLKKIFQKNIIGFIAFLLLVFEIVYFYSGYGWMQSLLLGLFFISIVVNNDFFKIFKVRASQFLGTISYSVYLLHGIVLFVSFRFVFGTDVAKTFSAFEHLVINLLITLVVVVVSSLTYKFVEYPFLKKYQTTIRK